MRFDRTAELKALRSQHDSLGHRFREYRTEGREAKNELSAQVEATRGSVQAMDARIRAAEHTGQRVADLEESISEIMSRLDDIEMRLTAL